MRKSTKKLTWLGHNCFTFTYDDAIFAIDPFLQHKNAPIAAKDAVVDYALVSHGHADHCADVAAFVKARNAPIIAVPEVASAFAKEKLTTEPINIGGAIYLPVSKDPNAPKAQILAVQAPHSSTMQNGDPGGVSLGFVLSFSQNGVHIAPDRAPIAPLDKTLAMAAAFTIYFACDSGYFSEMEWIGKLGVDIAVLPIGNRYTMGPAVSLDAIRAINPRWVVPSHYNTWAPIVQDVEKWADAVRQYTKASPLVLAPGESAVESEDGNWDVA